MPTNKTYALRFFASLDFLPADGVASASPDVPCSAGFSAFSFLIFFFFAFLVVQRLPRPSSVKPDSSFRLSILLLLGAGDETSGPASVAFDFRFPIVLDVVGASAFDESPTSRKTNPKETILRKSQ